MINLDWVKRGTQVRALAMTGHYEFTKEEKKKEKESKVEAEGTIRTGICSTAGAGI